MHQLSRSIHLSVHVHKDPDAMAERAAHIISAACEEAIAERGEFKMAISGGKTPIPLFRLFSQRDWVEALPWEKISLFWVDERCVSPDDPRSNYGVARRELLNFLPSTKFFRMRGDIDPIEAAESYEKTLRNEFNLKRGEIPRFDLVLLGMGKNGHTASLFPRCPGLLVKDRLVIDQYDAEKKMDRITLTLPVLNNARCCLFLVNGADKHAVLTKALDLLAEPELPAQLVHPSIGDLIWVVDQAAATGE